MCGFNLCKFQPCEHLILNLNTSCRNNKNNPHSYKNNGHKCTFSMERMRKIAKNYHNWNWRKQILKGISHVCRNYLVNEKFMDVKIVSVITYIIMVRIFLKQKLLEKQYICCNFSTIIIVHSFKIIIHFVSLIHSDVPT